MSRFRSVCSRVRYSAGYGYVLAVMPGITLLGIAVATI